MELRLPRTLGPSNIGDRRALTMRLVLEGAYISYDGQAMPCCMVSTPDRASFGNVLEDGLLPVWNGTQAERFVPSSTRLTHRRFASRARCITGVF